MRKGAFVREDEALQVEDVSALLGVGRNTVYSLAKSGELASYRVGRKLRFTRADVERYIEASKTGGSPASTGPVPVAPASAATPSSPYAEAIPEIAPAADPFVISGGDISGDIIAHAISGKGFPCSRAYLGSYLALVDLYLGRADAAVVHLFDRKSGTYNIPYVQRLAPGVPVSVVRVARRSVGLIVQAGNPKHLHSWGSLLTRDASLVNVARGSAMRVLLDEVLCELEARPESVRGYDREVASPDAVAAFVAKGAADMTLTDDNFATIVDAVREGRGIYANIKKVVGFLLGTNIGEILTVFFAMILWRESPFLSMQLLWINLVTDSLPAIALGMEAVEKDVMEQKPRPKNEGLFAHGYGVRIGLQGCMFAILSLLAYQIGKSLYGAVEGGQTLAFMVLALSQVVQAFNMRSFHSIFRIGVFTNRKLNGAALVSLALMALVLFIPPVAGAFGLVALSPVLYLIGLGLSLAPLIVMEIAKALELIKH